MPGIIGEGWCVSVEATFCKQYHVGKELALTGIIGLSVRWIIVDLDTG